jgi:hypothetical protein
LREFDRDSVKYSSLIDTNIQRVALSDAEIDRLYSLCDYGSMSTSQKVEKLDADGHTGATLDLFLDNVNQEEITLAHGIQVSAEQSYYPGSQDGSREGFPSIPDGSSNPANAHDDMVTTTLSYNWNEYA